MPDGQPAVGERNRYGETWNGTRWQKLAGSPLINDPLAAPSHVAGPQSLKNLLTIGGMIGGAMAAPEVAAPMLARAAAPAVIARFLPTLLRIGGAAVGGGAGRATGHAFTYEPDTTALEEARKGAIEGATAETIPAV